jgi:uncharacterized protein YndB with AHSA1/START domain
VKDGLTFERTYPHPPERVWRALTDREALGAWLMPNNFESKVGHKFRFDLGPQFGWRGYVDCVVLEVDEPRRLSYSWEGDAKHSPTMITWILTPVEGGTHLRLEHSGFHGTRGLFLKFVLGGGWKKKMGQRLPDVLAKIEAGASSFGPGPCKTC